MFTSSKRERNNQDPDVTIKLSSLTRYILRDSHYEPIDREDAVIIEALAKHQKPPLFHIEWRLDSTRPYLWLYHIWADSVERARIAKERSDRERKERFILEANIKLIAKGLQQHPFLMIDRWAVSTATFLLKKKRLAAIKAIGVSKLIDKIEDIP